MRGVRWTYFHFCAEGELKGRLVDDDTGYDIHPDWPSFQDEEQAEQWLRAHNIQGNVC